MSRQAIVLNRLTKNYGKHRGINDLSFSVNTGEIFGFIGPNGFFNLCGIANYSEGKDKTSANFMYNGDITTVMDKLHALPLTDVFLEEPSLEEIFLHYYE